MDPGQDDLPESTVDETPQPAEDFLPGRAYAPASHPGNDAERAMGIAAILDLQECAGAERDNFGLSFLSDKGQDFRRQAFFFSVGENPPNPRVSLELPPFSLHRATGDDEFRLRA